MFKLFLSMALLFVGFWCVVIGVAATKGMPLPKRGIYAMNQEYHQRELEKISTSAERAEVERLWNRGAPAR